MTPTNGRPWWWVNTSPALTIGIGAFWIALAGVQGGLFLSGTGNGWSAALAGLWLFLGVVYIVIGFAIRSRLRTDLSAAQQTATEPATTTADSVTAATSVAIGESVGPPSRFGSVAPPVFGADGATEPVGAADTDGDADGDTDAQPPTRTQGT
jgi:hypothetical protein